MTSVVPTTKLTRAEWTSLILMLVERVGYSALHDALARAIGTEKTLELAQHKAIRLSKRENWAIIRELYGVVPGAGRDEKVAWIFENARGCFSGAARFAEVVKYVRARVEDFEQSGGTLEQYPSGAVDMTGFLRFYGRANLWCAAGEAVLKQDVDLCARAGVGYMIELAGWRAGETAFSSAQNLENTIAMYNRLIGWCRAAGIPLFVSVVNWNITQTKYGNKGVPFTSIVPTAKKLAEAVFAAGPAGQIVQPVAETGKDDAAVEFEKWCGNLFREWQLCYNGGSRPKAPKYGWPLFAYHPNSTGATVPVGCLAVSDTGTIIRELAADGTLEGAGNPAKIKAWFEKCRRAGARGAGYYAFLREQTDADSVAACGAGNGDGGGTQDNVHDDGSNAPAGDSGQNNDIDLSDAVWHGPDGRKARVTESLTGLKIDSKKISYSLSKGTESWEPHNAAQKNCNQYSCFFVLRDGRYRGGKFDWSTYSRKTRELKNIRGGYTGGIVPRAGERVWFCFMDLNGKKRTNCQSAIWPG